MEAHYNYLSQKASGKDLLCIQDTTEYNYHHHSGLIEPGELGTISNGTSIGLRVHPMLVMDAHDGFAYGLSALQIINRRGNNGGKHARNYQALPIEQKESYRWLSAIEESKQRLYRASSLTFVSDRESDIYQLWSRIPDERTHLVVRSSFLRKFTDMESQSEIAPGSPMTPLGNTVVSLPAGTEKRTNSRDVLLEIAASQVWTIMPKTLKRQHGTNYPTQIVLTMVAVRETDPPEGAEPITWFLLTDLRVNSLQDALVVINIYKSRWNIEQLFRLSKHKGFNLEESQLERAHSLQNLIALVFIAAIRIYQMVSSRSNQNRYGTDLFSKEEITLLDQLRPGLEGKAERSKNNNIPLTLAYYLWIIARLGNWKPEDRDPPGPITFKRGWETLENYRKIKAIIPP